MFLSGIENLISQEYAKLQSHAEDLVEEFWDERKATIDNERNTAGTAVLGCRFKGKGHNLRVVWYKNSFRGAKGKRKVFSSEFKKPKGKVSYCATDFRSSKAPKWEVEMALEIEKELSKIRARKLELDVTLRSARKYYKNASELELEL